MNTPFQNFPKADGRLVYVRSIQVADLPEEVREQIGDDLEVIYAVHGADGQRLALVADRKLAFHLARQHDATPMSVH
jgi:hypothetical protein